jgi:hypothetical protein
MIALRSDGLTVFEPGQMVVPVCDDQRQRFAIVPVVDQLHDLRIEDLPVPGFDGQDLRQLAGGMLARRHGAQASGVIGIQQHQLEVGPGRTG